jgi:hypothetical protein
MHMACAAGIFPKGTTPFDNLQAHVSSICQHFPTSSGPTRFTLTALFASHFPSPLEPVSPSRAVLDPQFKFGYCWIRHPSIRISPRRPFVPIARMAVSCLYFVPPARTTNHSRHFRGDPPPQSPHHLSVGWLSLHREPVTKSSGESNARQHIGRCLSNQRASEISLITICQCVCRLTFS